MGDQQFCLRWNNHQSTLVAVFDNLLASESLVDVTLFAEGKFLKAHKVVLSACSPYFQALFDQHKDKHPIVILKDVRFVELKALIDYMYRGEVNVSQDQLSTLIKTAESLKIKGLADGSEKKAASTHVPSQNNVPRGSTPTKQVAEVKISDAGPRLSDHREDSASPSLRRHKRQRKYSGESVESDDGHSSSKSSVEQVSLPNIPATITPVPGPPATNEKEDVSKEVTIPVVPAQENNTPLTVQPKLENTSDIDNNDHGYMIEADGSDDEKEMRFDQPGPSGESAVPTSGYMGWPMPPYDCKVESSFGSTPHPQVNPQVPDSAQGQGDASFDVCAVPRLLVNLNAPIVDGQSSALVTSAIFKKFHCKSCNRRFDAMSSLQRHTRFECGVQRRFACPQCGSRFAHRFVLIRHIKLVHTRKFEHN